MNHNNCGWTHFSGTIWCPHNRVAVNINFKGRYGGLLQLECCDVEFNGGIYNYYFLGNFILYVYLY